MSGPSLPPFGSARAVLIGTATYTSRDLKPIPHSPRNIRSLKAVLTDGALGGFAAWDVELVDDPRKPQDIMRPVTAAAEAAQDALLIYYSGHGLLEGVTSDLHLSVTESETGQPWTSLLFSYLAGVVKQSPAAVKIVILDSCFSGRAHADLMGAESQLVRDQLAVTGVYSLSSAPQDRRSKAPEGATYSAFTGFLLAAMREGVPGAGPVLGASDLYNEVRRRMRSTGLPLPEECGKTGAGAFPLVRNRAFLPPGTIPAPAPRMPARPAAAGVPAPQPTTPSGEPSFDTVEGGGYDIRQVKARLKDVIAVVEDPSRWSQAKPPYFSRVSGRRRHGYHIGQVNAHIERHRFEPTEFVDALRLMLLRQGLTLLPDDGFESWRTSRLRKNCEAAGGERVIGYARSGATRNVAFTDTHLCVLDSPNLLRVPYSRLEDVSLSHSSHLECVVTVTDQIGLSEDLRVVTTTVTFGHRTLEFRESGPYPLQEALSAFLPAMAGLRKRRPEWFS